MGSYGLAKRRDSKFKKTVGAVAYEVKLLKRRNFLLNSHPILIIALFIFFSPVVLAEPRCSTYSLSNILSNSKVEFDKLFGCLECKAVKPICELSKKHLPKLILIGEDDHNADTTIEIRKGLMKAALDGKYPLASEIGSDISLLPWMASDAATTLGRQSTGKLYGIEDSMAYSVQASYLVQDSQLYHYVSPAGALEWAAVRVLALTHRQVCV